MPMEPSPDSDERIVEIEMERLRDFRNHPFKIMEDHEMKDHGWLWNIYKDGPVSFS